MSEEQSGLIEAPDRITREVGRIRGKAAGPTIVVMSGIHGNEPSGVLAARRMLETIARRDVPIRGELIVFAGNLVALESRVRFVDLDLNRVWTPARVEAMRRRRESGTPNVEDEQQFELLGVLGNVIENADAKNLHFLDLHTSSAAGAPFLTVGDTLRNRNFASPIPLPLILGLEEQVDGSLLEYLNNHGFITMGVEGGFHDAASSVDHHEAVLWLALVSAGMLDAADVPEFERQRGVLQRAAADHPRVIEVRHRHAISPEHEFVMEPGFGNFQSVRRGQKMATDRGGEIFSPEDGRVLLPLYQGQGDDGFFVCRDVLYFWLRVSALLRRFRLGNLMPLLPGVRVDADRPGEMVINTHVARWFPVEIFHLLGFRKLRHVGSELRVSRRCFDLSPPAEIRFVY